ncbi:thioesterase [Reichenbachiella sp. 5M10]|uniref:acyl-CoA thioesterase n=1 Tax=Reichenbachiella sp. 5M10 TaxID=1889772 RepID=UPI000C158EA9|nr:acyl-CoA thioesterase [Reichenbachiella sp. 5M10]PIB35137.1 thioesterase [Reichenbachiella sp. 5M10]
MFEFDPNKRYEKTTKTRSVIRFQDCDPLRHLNNAKYFDYYFNGREDQVPKLYGLQNSEIYQAFDAVWVVYNHQISYLRPAGMGEWVKLHSRVMWYDERSVLVEYFMTDDEETHLKNILWSKLRFVDNAGKSTEHPPKLMEFLSTVSFDDYASGKSLDFDQRLKEVKEEIKNQAIRYY